MSTDPLAEVLKRLASGQIRQDDLIALQQAVSLGRITIASQGGVAIGGNVSGGMVGTFVLPPEVLKLLQPAYQPHVPPLPCTHGLEPMTVPTPQPLHRSHDTCARAFHQSICPCIESRSS